MAQAGFTPIKLYLSTTAAAVPTAANLEPGELALNNNDGKLYYEDSSGVVQVIATKAGASGDVVGPASATDNAVARFDLTTGKLIQNSAVTIADDGATVIAANSASDGLRITQIGAGNALVVEDSANPDATPFVVDRDGVVGIGTTTPQSTFGISAGLGIQSSTAFAPAFIQRNKANDTSAPYYVSQKDRSGAIVQSGDFIGTLAFQAYDGSTYLNAAYISAQVDGTPGTNDMPGRLVFSTTADGASSPTERMRIDSAGRVGIGGTPTASYSVFNAKAMTGATTEIGYGLVSTIQSDVTTLASGYRSNLTTQATAFTLANLYHYEAAQSAFGAGSTVTNQYGFVVGTTLTGATNNYGFYGNIASGTGRYNFYASGTADNYFAGNVGIGTTTPAAKLAVVGTGYSPAITLTDGATLNWDTSLGQVAQVTLGGNRTFAAPTNLVNGGFYSLLIIQDGTGSRTISWNAVFDFTGGTAPTLSTAAGSKDLITWRSDGTNMLEVGRSLGVA